MPIRGNYWKIHQNTFWFPAVTYRSSPSSTDGILSLDSRGKSISSTTSQLSLTWTEASLFFRGAYKGNKITIKVKPFRKYEELKKCVVEVFTYILNYLYCKLVWFYYFFYCQVFWWVKIQILILIILHLYISWKRHLVNV